MRRKTIYLRDEAETIALGKSLARAIQPGKKIYLCGDIGSGKTTMVRAALQALGHEGNVKSPTFSLAEHYTVSIDDKPVDFIHFDLFRMKNREEFTEAGFEEYFGTDAVCIVEWPEKASGLIPEPDLEFIFLIIGTGRKCTIKGVSEQGAKAVGTICMEMHD